MKKRYTYRAYPTLRQQELLAQVFGCARVVFNDYLHEARERHEQGLAYSQGEVMKKIITDAKKTDEREWLSGVSSTALQQSARDAHSAYQAFFRGLKTKRKVGFPRFKRKSSRQTARFVGAGLKVRETTHGVGFVQLPRIGEIRFVLSRELPSKPSSATMILDPDGTYEVSFVVDVAQPQAALPIHPGRVAGIDVGLDSFAAIVYSDGTREKIENPRYLKKTQQKLARAQRELARKEKGSANRLKAVKRVAKAHSRVARQRKDFQNKLVSRLTSENQTVITESLNIKGMARSRLARSVHDAGWGQFLSLLEVKAGERQREFLKSAAFAPTSQTCSVCGVKDGPKPLHVRVWQCEHCSTVLDRDWNASVNVIVAAGKAETLNDCGGSVRRKLACATASETVTNPCLL